MQMIKKTKIFLIIISALLYGVPYYYGDLYFLSWFALLPFLYYIFQLNLKGQDFNYKKSFLAGWNFGFWILIFSANFLYHPLKIYTEANFLVVILILIIVFALLALIYGFFILLYSYTQVQLFGPDNFNPYLFTFFWIILELTRSKLLFFFPLANFAYTQTEFLAFIQLAEFGGTLFLTFILVLVNALLFKAVLKSQFKNILIILIIFTMIFIFGNYRLEIFAEQPKSSSADEIIEIGIIRTQIDQTQKWRFEQLDKNIELVLNSAEKLNQADLIIAPETNLSFDFIKGDYYRKEFLRELKLKFESPLQIGSLASKDLKGGRFNSSFLISKEGKILERYDKNLLLYFGEFYPYLDILNKIFPYNFSSLNPGTEEVIFKNNGLRWKTFICSEILYPKYVEHDQQNLDFIVNQTNEAWFNNSRLLKNTMWQAAVFRAVENRTPVIKTGNLADDGLILASGRYQKLRGDKNYYRLKLY